jgi:hypothetical protein
VLVEEGGDEEGHSSRHQLRVRPLYDRNVEDLFTRYFAIASHSPAMKMKNPCNFYCLTLNSSFYLFFVWI